MRRTGSIVALAGVMALAAPSTAALADTVTFDYTGQAQTWQVPAGVSTITVDAFGAQGGGPHAGLGGRALGTLSVTPGQVLQINVGGQGGVNGANNGGGGGGASDVRTDAFSLADRFFIAGGGGGSGGDSKTPLNEAAGGTGGAGGGGNGTAGDQVGGGGGAGATLSEGGAGGAAAMFGGSAGAAGALSAGGAGGSNPFVATPGAGGFNGGADGGVGMPGVTFGGGGGGGGGGLYGGGGGGSAWPPNFTAIGGGGGGGGGSSAGPAETTFTNGVRSGNGQVKVTYRRPCKLISVQITGLPIPIDICI